MIIRHHKLLILTGSLLWVTGFFLAGALIYPYAFIGVYLGPLILMLGIIGWIINYQRTKNQFPNPFKSFNRILGNKKGLLKYHSAFFAFMITYLLHFWVFCIVFWIGITFLGMVVFKNSNAFAVTKNYVEKDSELKNRIGHIKYYGFLMGGSVSPDGNADISFSIIGQKETINARAILEKGKVIDVNYK